MDSNDEQKADNCKRYCSKESGPDFFPKKEYSCRGKKKNLKITKKRSQARADEHYTCMPEKKVKRESKAAEGDNEQFYRTELLKIFKPDNSKS